ncbi:hypothetical protein KSD_28160 [Ktedonobacter sp. SOSP1-85]|nr:hypothetical protein KSD_28160 [Ktedonobacter sp. SOSP1-85]
MGRPRVLVTPPIINLRFAQVISRMISREKVLFLSIDLYSKYMGKSVYEETRCVIAQWTQ